MTLICRDLAALAPAGEFDSELVGTQSSLGSTYNRGAGIYRDVTNASSTKTWTYTPKRLTDQDTVTLVQNVAGSHQTARVANQYCAIEERLSLAVEGGGTYPRLTGFGAGTYAEHSWSLLKTKLDVAARTLGLFSGANYSSTCWAAGFDWSGVCKSNSVGGPTRRGTLITPRHVWLAKHYPYPVGTVLTFQRPDNSLVTRTVVGVAFNGPIGDSTEDEYIAVLNADVTGCTHYPVAGTWINENVAFGSTYEVLNFGAFLYVDQGQSVHLAPSHSPNTHHILVGQNDFGSIRFFDDSAPTQIDRRATLFDGYQSWMKLPQGGDSGSPVFAPLTASTMALATVMTGVYGGESPRSAVLNALIAAADSAAGISTGYSVTVASDPTP